MKYQQRTPWGEPTRPEYEVVAGKSENDYDTYWEGINFKAAKKQVALALKKHPFAKLWIYERTKDGDTITSDFLYPEEL